MTDVKICGLSTPETMEAALEAGARWVGLVFYGPSPRNVDYETGRLLADLARGVSQIVALGVDWSDETLFEVVEHIQPDYLQAHGTESPERVREMTEKTGLPVIKALPVHSAQDIEKSHLYDETASFLLYDAPMSPQGRPGGNGVAFEWSLLTQASLPSYFMLSGGLHLGNLEDALRQVNPPAVDVSSGVESSLGVKDPDRIRRFIEKVRSLS